MILTNCRLVPALCEDITDTTVDIRIEGEHIAQFLPAGGSYVGEKVIDCSGKTVLPGLFNLHVHLSIDDYANMRTSVCDPAVGAVNAICYAHDLLCHGYTNIRDVGCANNVAIKVRDMINNGCLVGPRITACGYVMTTTHPEASELYSHAAGRPLDNPDTIRRELRRQIAEGADFIKLLGCRFFEGEDKMKGSMFYPDEMAEIVNTVSQEDRYLAIHTIGPDSNRDAILMGAKTIEHGSLWSQENTDLLIAHKYKTSIVPTLAILKDNSPWDMCVRWAAGLQHPYDAGALIGFGTDSSHVHFIRTPAQEFLCRSEVLGWSSIEILKQATINCAKILGVDDRYGTIKVGKHADLAVFDGNPDEELSLLHNPCAYVLKDGSLMASHGMICSTPAAFGPKKITRE